MDYVRNKEQCVGMKCFIQCVRNKEKLADIRCF